MTKSTLFKGANRSYITKTLSGVKNDLVNFSKDFEKAKLKNEKEISSMIAIRCLGLAIDLFTYSGEYSIAKACRNIMDSI